MPEPIEPDDLPRWADGVDALVTEPTEGKKDVGWLEGERPPANFANWLAVNINEWITFLWTKLQNTMGLQADTELTIASGSITPTHGNHSVDTQSDASIDDLANIVLTNLDEGRLLAISPASDNRAINVKHLAGGSGQVALALQRDLILRGTKSTLVLRRVGTTMQEVARPAAQVDDHGAAAYDPLLADQFGLTRYSLRAKKVTVSEFSTGPLSSCYDGRYVWIMAYESSVSVVRIDPRTGDYDTFDYSGTRMLSCLFTGSILVFGGDNGSGTAARLRFVAQDGSVIASLSIASSGRIFGMCVANGFLWAAAPDASKVHKISLVDYTVVSTITVNDQMTGNGSIGPPRSIMCFDGTTIWIGGSGTTLHSIDPVTETVTQDAVTGVVAGGNGINSICYDGRNLWCASADADDLTRVDPVAAAVIDTAAATDIFAVAFDGRHVWAVLTNGTLKRYSPSNASLTADFTGPTVATQAAQPCFDGVNLWIAGYNTDDVYRIPVG